MSYFTESLHIGDHRGREGSWRDTSRVVNVWLFPHEEGMGAEELWNQCGNKVAMVTPQLLQTPVCVYVKE